MKANVINLAHRPDRMCEIEMECSREGLDVIRHEAVNGVKLFPDADKKLKGHFGCLHSHINLLKKVKGSNEYHLILEDDAILIEGFEKKIFNLITLDFDLLYLGGNVFSFENATETFDDKLNIAKNVLCTHAYIIKDESINGLLEVLESRNYKVDVLFTEYQKNHNCFITKECLSWQRESYSDIIFNKMTTNLKY